MGLFDNLPLIQLIFRTLQKQVEQARRHGAQLSDIVEANKAAVRGP